MVVLLSPFWAYVPGIVEFKKKTVNLINCLQKIMYEYACLLSIGKKATQNIYKITFFRF